MQLESLPAVLRASWATTAGYLLLLVVASALLYLVTSRYLVALVRGMVRRSRIDLDETLSEARVLRRSALLVPLLALQAGLPLVPGLSAQAAAPLQRLIAAGMMFVVALALDALLAALHALYLRSSMAAIRPIKSYVQLGTIAIYAVATVFIVAELAAQSPWFFVSGLGAMMAVILLIFRDTLLSLVASMQLTNNDLVRVGDWIEMPQFNADGDVVDIALNAVTVRNWDRTVSVIPTHKFLEHSFRNWRTMFEGGGRRIKRAIYINMSTTRFLTDEEIARFSRFVLLQDYMAAKVAELKEFNAQYAAGSSLEMNARRLTNIGTLRAYVMAYLRNHPKIHREMTLLVRQLAPTPEGLPLEIYAFTNDTRWASYESIQADIFDHILSIVPEFGLSVYQRPSGRDLAGALTDA